MDVPPFSDSQVITRKKNLSESDLPYTAFTPGHVYPKSTPDVRYSDACDWPFKGRRTDSMNNYLHMSDRHVGKSPDRECISPIAEEEDRGKAGKEDSEESEFLKLVKAANTVDVRPSGLNEDTAPSMMARSFSKQYSHLQRHSVPSDSRSVPDAPAGRQESSPGHCSSEIKRWGSDSSLNNFFFDDDDDEMLDEDMEGDDNVFKSDTPVVTRPNKDDTKDEHFRHSLPPMTDLKGFDLSDQPRYSLQPLMEISESVSSESQEESSHRGSTGSSHHGSIRLLSTHGSEGSLVSGSEVASEDSADCFPVDFPPIPDLPNPRQELTWGSASDQIRGFIAENRGPRELYLPPKSDELNGKAITALKEFLRTLDSDTQAVLS